MSKSVSDEEESVIKSMGWKIPRVYPPVSIFASCPLCFLFSTFALCFGVLIWLAVWVGQDSSRVALSQDFISYDLSNFHSLNYDSLGESHKYIKRAAVVEYFQIDPLDGRCLLNSNNASVKGCQFGSWYDLNLVQGVVLSKSLDYLENPFWCHKEPFVYGIDYVPLRDFPYAVTEGYVFCGDSSDPVTCEQHFGSSGVIWGDSVCREWVNDITVRNRSACGMWEIGYGNNLTTFNTLMDEYGCVDVGSVHDSSLLMFAEVLSSDTVDEESYEKFYRIGNDERIAIFLYKSGFSGRGFSEEHLKEIRSFETGLVNYKGFDTYCTAGCSGFFSSPVLNFFPSSWDFEKSKQVVDLLRIGGMQDLVNRYLSCIEFNDYLEPLMCTYSCDEVIGVDGYDVVLQECERYADQTTRISDFFSVVNRSLENDIFNFDLFQQGQGCDSECLRAPCLRQDVEMCSNLWDESSATELINLFDILVLLTDLLPRWDGEGVDLVENVDEMSVFMSYVNEINMLRFMVDGVVDKGFSTVYPRSTYTRSILRVSSFYFLDSDEKEYPFSRYFQSSDGLGGYIEPRLMDSHGSEKYTLMVKLIFESVNSLLINDLLWSSLSFLIILGYMWFSFGSLFLAFVGLLQVVLAVPIGLFFYSYVLGYTYHSPMNALVVFIAASIGVDDLFVFVSNWNESVFAGPGVLSSPSRRMQWVWWRSVVATGVTSLSTSLSFFSACLGPLDSMCSFGVIAGVSVLVDFVLVNLIFACAVLVYHNRWEGRGSFLSPSFRWKSNGVTTTLRYIDEYRKRGWTSVERGNRGGVGVGVLGNFGRRVRGLVYDLISSGFGRVVLLLVSCVWCTIAIVLILRLRASNSAMQFLNEDHMLQKASDVMLNRFDVSSVSPSVVVYYVWGIDGIDRKGVNVLKNSSFLGVPQYSGVDLPSDQYRSCRDAMLRKLNVLNAVSQGYVDVGIEDVQDLFRIRPDGFPYIGGTFPGYRSDFDKGFYDFTSELFDDVSGFDSGDWEFLVLGVASPDMMPVVTYGRAFTEWRYDRYEQLGREVLDGDGDIRESCGIAANASFFVTDSGRHFVFMETQRLFIDGLVSGVAVGVGIAVLSVFVVTYGSVPVTLFTFLTVSMTLISVLAVASYIGWEIGVIEGVLFSVLSGFSVDYVVHMGISYVEESRKGFGSKEVPQRALDKRLHWIHAVIDEVGASNMNAALTSILACVPMFFCEIMVFQRFCVFLIMTASFSLFYSSVVFLGLLAAFGVDFYIVPRSIRSIL